MRLKLGILNFSNILSIVLVVVSLWGNKLFIQEKTEIQNTTLIIENSGDELSTVGDNCIEVQKNIELKVNKHIIYFRFSE